MTSVIRRAVDYMSNKNNTDEDSASLISSEEESSTEVELKLPIRKKKKPKGKKTKSTMETVEISDPKPLKPAKVTKKRAPRGKNGSVTMEFGPADEDGVRKTKTVNKLTDEVLVTKLREQFKDLSNGQPQLGNSKDYFNAQGIKYFNPSDFIKSKVVASASETSIYDRVGVSYTIGTPKGDSLMHRVQSAIRKQFALQCVYRLDKPGYIINLGGDRWICHIIDEIQKATKSAFFKCFNVIDIRTTQMLTRSAETYPGFTNIALEGVENIVKNDTWYLFGSEPYCYNADEIVELLKLKPYDNFLSYDSFSDNPDDLIRVSDNSITWKNEEDGIHVLNYGSSETFNDTRIDTYAGLVSDKRYAFDVKGSHGSMFFTKLTLIPEGVSIWEPITGIAPYTVRRRYLDYTLSSATNYKFYVDKFVVAHPWLKWLFKVLPRFAGASIISKFNNFDFNTNMDNQTRISLLVYEDLLQATTIKKYEAGGRYDLARMIGSDLNGDSASNLRLALKKAKFIPLQELFAGTVDYLFYETLTNEIAKRRDLIDLNAYGLEEVTSVRKLTPKLQEPTAAGILSMVKTPLLYLSGAFLASVGFLTLLGYLKPRKANLLKTRSIFPRLTSLLNDGLSVITTSPVLSVPRRIGAGLLNKARGLVKTVGQSIFSLTAVTKARLKTLILLASSPLFEELLAAYLPFKPAFFFRLLTILFEVQSYSEDPTWSKRSALIHACVHFAFLTVSRLAGFTAGFAAHFGYNAIIAQQPKVEFVQTLRQADVFRVVAYMFQGHMFYKASWCPDITVRAIRKSDKVTNYMEYLNLYKDLKVHETKLNEGVISLHPEQVGIPVHTHVNGVLFQTLLDEAYEQNDDISLIETPAEITPKYYKIAGNSSLLYAPGGHNMAMMALTSRIIAKKPSDCDCTMRLARGEWTTTCHFTSRWRTFYSNLEDYFTNLFYGTEVRDIEDYIADSKKCELYTREYEADRTGEPTLYQQKHDENIGYKDIDLCLFCSRTQKGCLCDPDRPFYSTRLYPMRYVRSRIYEKFPTITNLKVAHYLEGAQARWKDDSKHDNVFVINNKKFCVLWACGMNPKELSAVYDRAMDLASQGIYVIVQLGDDSAGWIYFNINGRVRVFALEADYSSFDRSQGYHVIHEVHSKILQILGVPREDIWVYFDGRSGNIKFRVKGHKYKINFPIQLCSGEQGTCFFNSITNVVLLVNFLAFSEDLTPDNFAVRWKDFLMSVGIKCSFCNLYELTSAVTFLKGWWLEQVDGARAWCPLPSQILAKACKIGTNPIRFYCLFNDVPVPRCSRGNYLIRREYRTRGMYLCAYALSFFCGKTIPNVPIILEYLSKMRLFGLCYLKRYERSTDKEAFEDKLFNFYRELDDKYYHWDVEQDVNYNYNDALLHYCMRYDLPASDITELCYQITNGIRKPWDFLISNTANYIVRHDYLVG